MKKLISLVIAAAISVSLFGCGEKKTPPANPPANPPGEKDTPAPETPATPAPEGGAAPAPEGKAP